MNQEGRKGGRTPARKGEKAAVSLRRGSPTMDERKRRILCAIVEDYVETASPVGSRTVCGKYLAELSSATIRNEMGNLTELGYLEQPHISAGRVPTASAYRFYVDSLDERSTLTRGEHERIDREILSRVKQLSDVVQSAADVLSDITNYATVVMMPKQEELRIRSLHLVPITRASALIVVVTDGGIIRDSHLHVSDMLDHDALFAISRMLSDRLRHKTLREAQQLLWDYAQNAPWEPQVTMGIAELAAQLERQSADDSLKVAGSLDGRTALPNGVSQWITGPEAREDGQRWRARACAVLTGSGTVLRDNPLLNVRLPGVTRQPLLAVLDSRLQTPPDAALWQVPERAVRLYATDAAAPERWQRLQQLGAQIQQYPADAQETVPLAEVLRDLARHEVNEVHVEAGARLNGALWQAGLVDELLLYQAPMLLGEGAPLAQLPMRHELDGAPRLQLIELTQVGPDVRIRAQKPPALKA